MLLSLAQKLKNYASYSQAQNPSSGSSILKLNQAQNNWLEGKGLEFFTASLTHLHHNAIDASTGASAFVPPDFVEAELKRIATLNLIEYNSHVPTAQFVSSAEKYFRQIDIINKSTNFNPNNYGKPQKEDYLVMVGHGTTDLYNRALKAILKTPGDIIILTEPTYGLFVKPVLNQGGEVATLALNKSDHFKPSSKELESLVLTKNKEKKQQFLTQIKITKKLLKSFNKDKSIKRKLKPVRQDLTSLRRAVKKSLQNTTFTQIDAGSKQYNESLTKSLAKLFDEQEACQWMEKLKLPLCARVRGYLHINPHMPMGTICSQDEINVLAETINQFPDFTVIDDLTYYDLILPAAKTRPGTFAKSKIQDKTITLYSPSKQFAIAGIRSCFGNQSYLLPITKDIFYGVNSTSIYSDTALHAIFRMSANERKKYLSENNTDYGLRRDFAIALIQGTKGLSAPQLIKIKTKLTSLGIKKEEQQRLLEGIGDLSIVVKPDSGFFLLLDFSKHKGKYLGTTQLNQGSDFRNALFSFTNLDTIAGEMCLYSKKPVLRFSYSIAWKDIVESVYRIKSLLALCNDKPIEAPLKSVEPQLALTKTKTYTPKYQNTKKKLIKTVKLPQRSRSTPERNKDFIWTY